MQTKNLIIWGKGGQSKVVADIASKLYSHIVYIDNNDKDTYQIYYPPNKRRRNK